RDRGEIPRQLPLRRLGRREGRRLARIRPHRVRCRPGRPHRGQRSGTPSRPVTIQGMTMAGKRELEGRVALVTGASRNIGRAIALALADGGAAVVVNARASKDEAMAVVEEIKARGGRAMVGLADVADEAAVNAMV